MHEAICTLFLDPEPASMGMMEVLETEEDKEETPVSRLDESHARGGTVITN